MLTLKWDGYNLLTQEKCYAPRIRTIGELLDVLMDPPEDVDPKTPAYYMYRGVCLLDHAHVFEKNNVRYDVTVIPPRRVGNEFIKTFGHYHPTAEHDPITGNPLSFPEVYEVLHGEALFLLQDRDARNFFAVRARAGKTVLIPPNLGHVTVNPSDKTLVMVNLVSSRFSSDYTPVREKKGFAWYYTVTGWVKNPRYTKHPEIKEARPFLPIKDIYSTFVEYPKLFDFLNRPSKMNWSQII